ncbi:hypothetical protein ACWGY7_07045 [Xanthomonas axonopodis pv. khayae]|uniref:hypothetical protein n=1 Tax=Xanthomonas axonopodis TaxID=53413 RepID=UPI0011813519|nr:hypothetical protein [Xanthomonas axonopodis]
MGRTFDFVSQLALYRKIKTIGRYILFDQAVLGQLFEQVMPAKDGVFNDVMTFKDDITGRHLLSLHHKAKTHRSATKRIYQPDATRPG